MLDPSSIYGISVMPCVAKKHEIDIPVMNDSGYRDGCRLTTREVVRMIHAEHIDVRYLQDHPLDNRSERPGWSGVLFGATGDVMECSCTVPIICDR